MNLLAAQQKDLQVLEQILQERLRTEVPRYPLQVRCANPNRILLVLIEHPEGASVDTQAIFNLLQQELQSLKPQVKQQVQLFVRTAEAKRPYAKHAFILEPPATAIEPQPPFIGFDEPPPDKEVSHSQPQNEAERENPSSLWEEPVAPGMPNKNLPDQDPSILWSEPTVADVTETVTTEPRNNSTNVEPEVPDVPDSNDNPSDPSVLWGDVATDSDATPREVDEVANTVANTNEIASDPSFLWGESPQADDDFDATDEPGSLVKLKPKPNLKPLLVGGAVAGVVALVGGGYIAAQPCAIGACEPLQNALRLENQSAQMLRKAKNEQQLTAVQQQLQQAVADLKPIPSWSPHYQQAQQITPVLSAQSESINKVVAALQTGTQAEKMQAPPNSFPELQTTQSLWRKAITPLEAIPNHSPLSGLAQANLRNYRASLKTVNQQIKTEQQIANRISRAKAVAQAATTRQAAAKTLAQWQTAQATWQVAVNTLASIPQSNFAYLEAQRLLSIYQTKLATVRDLTTKEQIAAKAYNRAVNSANLAQRYEQQNQWSASVINWNRAVEAAKQVPSDSTYSAQAQPLVNSYAAKLQTAEQKLKIAQIMQTARADLNKTCGGAIRICNFSVNGGKITVRLTSEYEQAVQRSMMGAASRPVATNTNHMQILLQALEVVSQNTNLPLTVYTSQNQQIYPLTPAFVRRAMATGLP